jgi:hypothetical protein
MLPLREFTPTRLRRLIIVSRHLLRVAYGSTRHRAGGAGRGAADSAARAMTRATVLNSRCVTQDLVRNLINPVLTCGALSSTTANACNGFHFVAAMREVAAPLRRPT